MLPRTTIKRLESIQHEALRAVVGTYRTCPHDFLRLEANVEPLWLRYQKNDEIMYDKYKRLPEGDSRRAMVDSRAPNNRLDTRHGWRNTIAPRVNEEIMRDVMSVPPPPWRELVNLKVDYVQLEKKKDRYSPEELRSRAIEKMESLKATITIFTDGSTSGRQERGGAGVFVQDEQSKEMITEMSFAAGRFCSSYTGECVGLLEAMRWVKNREATEGSMKVLICTDSMSLTQALEKDNWKDQDYWVKQIKDVIYESISEITLLWVPAHCDLESNEKADELAKRGSELNQSDTPVIHKIVKAKIKNRKWVIEHERAASMFGERRSPRVDIEREWPRSVQTLFSRLRSDHAVELKHYRWKHLHQ